MKLMQAFAFLCLAAFARPAAAEPLGPEAAREVTQEAVADILDALAERDFDRLAAHVGKGGLTVSPYVMLDVHDVLLDSEEVGRCAQEKRIRLWGYRDGSGDPIETTCERYFAQFVWDADYRKADEVLYNEPRQRGNEINNNHGFVRDAIVVELHLGGTAAMSGMDWKSLRLIFRQGEQGLSLVAITRDIWTI
ncbi:hypothetical protein [Microvirga roseola]|uniref:hypothetical protein n=1 Tax=Microvirga roseola TaxID=2883126 RepID=UPI001E3B52A8|nr:hypothetical protein [Microvirga roseola]